MNNVTIPCTLQISKLYDPSLTESCVFFTLKTDGFYWRTGHILEADLVFLKNGIWMKQLLQADPKVEEEEYELLQALLNAIHSYDTIYTFNGTAFTIPFLTAKLKAFDLPLKEFQPEYKNFHDYYLEYKPLYYFLKLPSRRLKDYSRALDLSVTEEEEMLLNISQLKPFLNFFRFGFKPIQVQSGKSSLLFVFSLLLPVPRKASYGAGPFYLLLEDCIGKLSVTIENGKIRHYFGNYKDYEFLTEEGYAIHKSLASFVKPSRRKPADRETAYTLLPAEGKIQTELEAQNEYLISCINYLQGHLNP